MSKTSFEVMPGKQEVIMRREFNAPRELVFKAFTSPDIIAQWWGGNRYKTKIETMDAKAGGTWRFVQEDEKGESFGFHGVYHSVTPEQIVHTFEFEGVPGHVLLETIRFKETDGKTLVTDISVYQSVEDRDGMVNAGMQSGAVEAMEALAKLIE